MYNRKIMALEENELDMPIITDDEENVGTDLVDTIELFNNIDSTNNSIIQADSALNDLDKYEDIANKDNISEDALDTIEIAVESLRVSLGFKKSKLATEKFSSKKELVLEGIKETAKKIWEAIINSFKKLKVWIVDFFKSLFDKSFSITNKLKKLRDNLKELNINNLEISNDRIYFNITTAESIADILFKNSYNDSNVEKFNKYLDTLDRTFESMVKSLDIVDVGYSDVAVDKLLTNISDYDRIFNYQFYVHGDSDFKRISFHKTWLPKQIEIRAFVKEINIQKFINLLDRIIKNSELFNNKVKNLSKIQHDIDKNITELKNMFNHIHEDDPNFEINKELLKKQRSNLHFYTHFIPSFNKEVYHLLVIFYTALNKMYNQIKDK